MTAQKPSWTRTVLPIVAVVLLVAAAPARTQQINSLSESTLARSGRLLIRGTGFGNTPGSGQVLIDGLTAIATTWSNTEIHAYVPELAGPGQTLVVVEADGGTSNGVFLDVTLRQTEGRFRWRFQLDNRAVGPWSAVGPDGTIYCSDPFRLYALTPGGGLLWALAGAGARRPITFGADGTIYAAAEEVPGEPQGVVAVNPDGTLRWAYSFDSGFDLMAGPGVGPDGNIYAVSNTNLGGPGTFALDSDGNLLWTNPGPGANTINLHEIDFSPDRFYISYNGQGGPPEIIAYDYSGNVIWNSHDLGQTMGSAPELDPSERLILAWGLIGVQAWSPEAFVEWIYNPSLGNVVPPAVGPDGVIYSGTWLGGDLFAINPDGTERWLLEDQINGFLWNLGVSPDNAVLVDGGAPNFGRPSTIRGFDTQDGALLWLQNFHIENGLNEFANWAEPVFTPDSQTAYVTTEFSGDTQPGYLYAVDLAAGGVCVKNCLRSAKIDVIGKVKDGDLRRVMSRVKVEDENGAPVPSAEVSVIWTLPDLSTKPRSAVTNQRGYARFQTFGGSGDYIVTVTGVTKNGYSFDPDHSILFGRLTMP